MQIHSIIVVDDIVRDIFEISIDKEIDDATKLVVAHTLIEDVAAHSGISPLRILSDIREVMESEQKRHSDQKS